jgi:hypothetical protein
VLTSWRGSDRPGRNIDQFAEYSSRTSDFSSGSTCPHRVAEFPPGDAIGVQSRSFGAQLRIPSIGDLCPL